MNTLDFNFIATLISIISIAIATYNCYQTSKITKESRRSYVYLYLVSTRNATYVKVKNFGHTAAKIINFETNVDTKNYYSTNHCPFPLVGLQDIHLAPGASKIGMIEHNVLNQGNNIVVHWIDENTNKKYSYTLTLNTFGEYALVHSNDFDIIDY